jgi:hypothetical protein
MNTDEITELGEDLTGVDETSVVSELVSELDAALRPIKDVRSRQETAYRMRHCEWEGQSEDGKKHRDVIGREPHPFEGASDERIFLVDSLINEDVEILVNSFFGASVQTQAESFEHMGQSRHANALLQWLRSQAMQLELVKEVELLANYQQGDEPGAAVLGVFWNEPSRVKRIELSEAAAVRLSGDPLIFKKETVDRVEKVMQYLRNEMGLDPREDAVAAAFKAFDAEPEADSISVPVRMGYGLPTVTAYKLGYDIFFNYEVDDIEDAAVVFTWEKVNKQQLLARVDEEGYSQSWVDQVLEKGTNVFHSQDLRHDEAEEPGEGRANEYYEIWRCVRKVSLPELDGALEIWQTVFNPAVVDELALDEPLGYDHGMYPFQTFKRERIGRGITKSRGVSSIASTQQAAIKTNRDNRNDALQLATAPPFTRRVLRGGAMLGLAPFKEVRIRAKDDFSWLTPPPFPSQAMQMEEAVRGDVDDYFGRIRPDGSPTRSQVKQQKMVNTWLACWAEAWRQMLSLCQQYMDPMVMARVLSVWTREELQQVDLSAEFTLTLTFDVRNLNMEFLKEKIALLQQVAGLDSNGVIDMTLVGDLLHAVDPYWGKHHVRDVGAVTEQERHDEIQNLVAMSAGIEPELKDKGQNHALRLQVLQETMQRAPKLMEQYNGDDNFKKLLDTRMQSLQFVAEQNKRGRMGAVGAKPVQN